MIIAEDVLLLAYDDETGAPDAWVNNLDYRLAGALLVELALEHRVDLAGPGETAADGGAVKEGRVVVRDASPTGHPELDAALGQVAERPRKPADLVEPLAGGLEDRLLERLVDRGVLRREERTVLRFFRTTRWPAEDSAHEAALREHLRAVLLDGVAPAPREAALLAVLQGSGLVSRLVPRERRKDAERRASELAESGWASAAAGKAIDELTATIVAAVIVPAVIIPAATT
ncbi:GPP34 family phosphoprotein [Xylanimonas oleitrophica]|uniref:GPP34 family phosphoprotein n=1 Tax=Xylanimonas oleitrophica TaxID=2607479 RepID=A0A2W5WN09_9MICO|nr:GPP34 family phosphoprotein [Xylanimonas oleitrophica]PZR52133.1 GPP34 family phosphoprotein [Xylanimonas oleitrophica]